LIGKIMTEDPLPLATLRPDSPAGLLAVLERALAKDREARYASCHDLQADLEALLVSLGKTITAARISDFAKAYAEPVAAPDESTGAAMQALEAEMNGTGPVRPVQGRRAPAQPREPRTVVLPPAPARARRGLAYGLAAFLSVAVGGGAGGYAFLLRRAEPPPDPIPVERAAPVEQPEPKPTTLELKQETAQAPEKPKPAETEPPLAQAAPAQTPAETTPPVPSAPSALPAAPETAPAASPPAPPPQIVPPAPKPRARKMSPPAPPADDSTPVVTAKGELVLRIRPWAKVEVDGLEIGVTPLSEPLMLAAGEHTVRLINPDLGKDVTRTVRITASEKEVLKELLDE
jgi:serine/threonine-protein kinase